MTPRSSASGQTSAILYWSVTLATWLFVNAAAALGLLLALFILMANATWLTFFTEAENLARHFVVASAAARADFARLVSAILVVLFVCLCLSRLAALRHAAAPAPSRSKPS